MSDHNTSVQIDGQTKQQILEAARKEMARYEKELRNQEQKQKEKTSDLPTVFILLLLFVLACGLIVSFASQKPATTPLPDNPTTGQLK